MSPLQLHNLAREGNVLVNVAGEWRWLTNVCVPRLAGTPPEGCWPGDPHFETAPLVDGAPTAERRVHWDFAAITDTAMA